MASGARAQHPFWDTVPLEVVAAALASLLVLLNPIRGFDEVYLTALLQQFGSSQPPERVIVVSLDAPRLKDQKLCDELGKLERDSKARALLFLPPAEGVCTTPASNRWHVLDVSSLKRTRAGGVIGFRSEPGSQALVQNGIRSADWVSPHDWRSVPSVKLSDLVSGRVNSNVLAKRLVVVSFEEPERFGGGRAPLSASVAAALAGAAEGGTWQVLARGWLALLILLVCGGWYAAGRWRVGGRSTKRIRAGLSLATLALWGTSLFGLLPLLPLPSVGLGLLCFFALSTLPRFVAERRAQRGTRELLSRARQIDAEAPHALPADIFWVRLAKRIARAHPADGVLVAELPPFSWRLRVHDHGDLTETIIRERRRDIRRWPYSDEHGKRNVHIARDFVVTNVPTVLVPLEAAGEVEGYIFLIGQSAEDAFVARPELTLQLADEAAQLIRQRRLEQQRADEWRRPAGVLVEHPDEGAENLLLGARAAFDRLQLFGEVLDSASVGLMYADAFGDVRVLSKPFRDQLPALGLAAPEVGAQGMLAPGALPLPGLLKTLAEAAHESAPGLDEIGPRPHSYDVPVAGAHKPRYLQFRVTRLEGTEHGGFVGSLVEIAPPAEVEGPALDRIPEAPDPLLVFSLSQLLVDVVDNVKRRTQGKIRLQTPRVMAHIFGHRRELSEALEEFLVDAANQQGKHEGVTLVVKERQYRVELSVLDLRLGVPVPALRRTLLAPSEPPPGLGPMGAFARAVENSHGTVALRNEEGWGARLSVALVRARPRLEPKSLAPVVDLHAVEQGNKHRPKKP